MTLTQLRCFRTLAQTQHYKKASELLYISQPALSKTIRQLETELGIKCFKKDGRNIVLTEAGKLFLDYVDRSLTSLDDGIQEITCLAESQIDKLSIGCITPVIISFLGPILEAYRQTCKNQMGKSDMEIRTWSGMSYDLLQGVERGTYDVAFCSKIDTFSSLCFTQVCELPIVVAMRRDDSLAPFDEIEPSQLMGRDMLFTDSVGYSDFIRNMLAYYHVDYRATGYSNEDTALIGMVEAGQGIFISNDYPQIHTERTTIKPLHAPEFHRYVYMAYDPNRKTSQRVQSFINFVLSGT